MCNFASFILTKNNEYYLEDSDSHEDIIAHYHLKDDEINIVRVELIPPYNKAYIQNINQWIFYIDQDIYPPWSYAGDPTLKEKALKALARRIKDQKIGYTVECGDSKKIKVGCASVVNAGNDCDVIAGSYGVVYAGECSTVTVGNLGIAITKEQGRSIVGKGGTAIAGYGGQATAGNDSKAIAGPYGIAIAGNYGKATVGNNGKAKAGINGIIYIDYFNNNDRRRTMVGYIGEDGIEPDTFYKVENGKLVKVEEKE
jgi:hypothetical protein